LAHMMHLLLEGKPSGVLGMPAIHQIAERWHAALRLALEPDRPHALSIDRGDLLAGAQVSDRARPRCRAHAVGYAAAGSAAVEPEHQPRPLRRAAMNEGINAQRPMRSYEA